MRAIVYSKYGSPEAAKLMAVPKPLPRDNEVLVEVYSSTVNRTDSGFLFRKLFLITESSVLRMSVGAEMPVHHIFEIRC